MANSSSKKLIQFAKELLDKKSLKDGIPLIAKYAKEVVGAERCSIFIYDNTTKELWTIIADGLEKIIIDKDKGLVGHTLKSKKPIIANDAYNHIKFVPVVDEQTGYKTKNIATAPILDSHNNAVGVLELLNKNGDFDNDDIKSMTFFAEQISSFIELTNAYSKKDRV